MKNLTPEETALLLEVLQNARWSLETSGNDIVIFDSIEGDDQMVAVKNLIAKVSDESQPEEEDDMPNEVNPFGTSDYGEPTDCEDPKDEYWYNDSSRRLPNVGR